MFYALDDMRSNDPAKIKVTEDEPNYFVFNEKSVEWL
jgi:hypothetical protein